VSRKLRLLVSAALLGWFACKTDWVQIGRAFAHLRVELWLAAVGLYALTQLISSMRWQCLAQPFGFQQPLAAYVRLYFVGTFYNLLLPTSVGGDVVRAWSLDDGSGRRGAAFLSVLADRLSGLLVLLAMAALATLLCPVPLRAWIPASVWATTGAAILGLASVPFLARNLRRLEIVSRLVAGLRLFLDRPRFLLITSVLSLLVQAGNVALVWLVGLAIEAPVPGSYYWIVVPMVTLLTLLPVSLNGMGVREGGLVLFLLPVGVPETTALALAFLWFLVFLAAGMCGGALNLFDHFRRSKERTDHGFIGSDSHQGRARQSQAAA
jgi:uncharacterized membrane protein YbhN (UPF0104 family)